MSASHNAGYVRHSYRMGKMGEWEWRDKSTPERRNGEEEVAKRQGEGGRERERREGGGRERERRGGGGRERERREGGGEKGKTSFVMKRKLTILNSVVHLSFNCFTGVGNYNYIAVL